MCRIIVTVLLGFLNVGRLTSTLVFIYVFCANAFFLVSPNFPHLLLVPQASLLNMMYCKWELMNSSVPSNTSFSPILPKLPQSLLPPCPIPSELEGSISYSSWLVVRSFGWVGYLESSHMHALKLDMI